MECYALDSSYAAARLVDDYFSFIWTERYSSPSDFTIELPATSSNMSFLKEGVILMISESDQPQVIETVQLKKDDDGKKWIVKGRDLTTWLELRLSPYDTTYTGLTVSQIAFNMINKAAISADDTNDRIPNMGLSNRANDTVKFDFETSDEDLLTDVQNILNDNGAAIRCERVGGIGTYSFRYYIYTGTKKAVVFSDRDDTLIHTQYIRSTKKWRNRAEIRYKASNKEDAKTLRRIIYGNGGGSGDSGLNRRTIRVDATSINPNDYPGTRFITLLDRMARAALSQNRKINAIDGEVPAYTSAKYGKDYTLGDMVQFKSDNNVATDVRVTEYIWIIDESGGLKSYPTIDVVQDISV